MPEAFLAPARRGISRLGMIDIPHLDDLHRNVVTHLPFFSQGNQSFTRLSRVVFHRRLEDFVVQDEPIQAIGTLQDNVLFE
jgi:hypothetical protein